MQIQHLILEQLIKTPATSQQHTLSLALGKTSPTQTEGKIQLFDHHTSFRVLSHFMLDKIFHYQESSKRNF